MLSIVKPESLGFDADRLNRITPHMQKYIEQERVAGIVSLVARRGQVCHFEAFGQRDIERDLPMEKDTIFRIYSMTKPITSVAAMMLLEEGLFQLDDPVANYIPAFRKTRVCVAPDFHGLKLTDQDPEMTIRHLMTHTAGLSYGFFEDTPIDKRYQNAKILESSNLEEMVEKIARIPLVFQPGTKWRYSVATDVLGRVVEIISGMSLDDFFQNRIFKPLGMNETGFWVAEENLDRFAAMYEIRLNGPNKLADDPQTGHWSKPKTFFSGGGGLTSTTADYLRFCQMLQNGGELDGVRLLGPKTVELMRLNQLPESMLPIGVGAPTMLGYGWGLSGRYLMDVAKSGMPGNVGSYGWAGAANTYFWIDPVDEIIGMVMTQLLPSGYYPLAREFRTLTYGALIE